MISASSASWTRMNASRGMLMRPGEACPLSDTLGALEEGTAADIAPYCATLLYRPPRFGGRARFEQGPERPGGRASDATIVPYPPCERAGARSRVDVDSTRRGSRGRAASRSAGRHLEGITRDPATGDRE